jgi:hypothetical protein
VLLNRAVLTAVSINNDGIAEVVRDCRCKLPFHSKEHWLEMVKPSDHRERRFDDVFQ